MNQRVAQISLTDALKLNDNFNEPNKVAFQNAQGTEFYTYLDIAQDANIKFKEVQLTPSVVDGTFPVFPRRKMFPR